MQGTRNSGMSGHDRRGAGSASVQQDIQTGESSRNASINRMKRTTEVHEGVVLGRGSLQEKRVHSPYCPHLSRREISLEPHGLDGQLLDAQFREERTADPRTAAVAGHEEAAIGASAVLERHCH